MRYFAKRVRSSLALHVRLMLMFNETIRKWLKNNGNQLPLDTYDASGPVFWGDMLIVGKRLSTFGLILVMCVMSGLAAIKPVGQNALPILFFRNTGRWAAGIDFIARTPTAYAYFSKNGAEIRLHGAALQIEFVGANPEVSIKGGKETGATANFLVGDTPERWTTNVTLYETVKYQTLYPGIDMTYGGTDRRLKSEFIVAPGADPTRIRLKYSGFDRIGLEADGSLLFRFSTGELQEEAPNVYQVLNGKQVSVPCKYEIDQDGTVGFTVQSYDTTQKLIIDPVLSYSTYLGGSGFDAITGIAADSSGNVYVSGYTDSTDFPIVGAIQGGSGGGVDAFVAKLNSAGTLIYATYIGGSGDDRARGITLDASGNIIIAGSTTSPNFPRVAAFQSARSGARDAFISKLNAAGNALVFSTYFGGTGYDYANAVTADSGGNVYIAGETYSTDLPTLNAVQASNNGRQDAFVTKFSSAGILQYSTLLGGAGDDRALAIAVDTSGSAYLTGSTTSSDFPLVNAFQPVKGGGQDAFVVKLGPSGSSIAYSTYLGGSGGTVGSPEVGNGIAVDSGGGAYVTGVTSSSNFPTLSALQAAHAGGGVDAFVTKFNSTGPTLGYSTYIGGIGLDTATAIAVDSLGNAYVAGTTTSPNFPTLGATQSSKSGSMDAFILSINPAGTTLNFSSYFGGASSDTANAITINGSIWIAGQTTSTDFPVLTPFQAVGYSEGNGFIVRFDQPTTTSQAPAITSVTPSSGSGTLQSFRIIVSDAIGNADIRRLDLVVRTAGLSGNSNSCSVTFDRASNQLLLLHDNGVGYSGGIALAGPASLENSQCIVSGIRSSLTSTATTITLDVTLGFKQAFTVPNSAKFVSTTAYNAAGVASVLFTSSWTVPTVQGGCSLVCASGSCSLLCF